MMTNKFMRKREKIKAQVKSRFYYWFWGATAVAVVGGQLYVGTGYRRMSETGDAISADINLLVEVLTDPRPRTMPAEKPLYEPHQMPIIR